MVKYVYQTVGALLSRAYTSGGCILGAIFGTGTNGAYVEEVGGCILLCSIYSSIQSYPNPIHNLMILTHRTSFFYLAKITKLANSPAASKGGYMVVNTEWGAFNNSVSVSPSVHPIHTDFDTLFTPSSSHPFSHSFHYYIATSLFPSISTLSQRSHLPTTPFDNALDRTSINPRFQASGSAKWS